MDVYLGIDWGGTYIKAGIVTASGKILKKIVYNSKDLRDKKTFIAEIKALLRDFSGYKIKAVGIGAPGIINIEKGFIYYLPNVSGWHNYPLRDVLRKELHLPVFVDNDANLFALAEARIGAAKGLKYALFITLGTGLGGAVIWEGKILESRTSATEIGHFPVNLNGKSCSCGGRGCIETYVGIRHLLERYHQLKSNSDSVKEVKDIYQLAKKGQKEALIVWQEFSHALGMFLAGMVNIFGPQAIVVGGGVSGAFSLFKPMVLATIKKQAMDPQAENLKLVKAKIVDAGIIGASLLAYEKMAE
jgi:glucokinase